MPDEFDRIVIGVEVNTEKVVDGIDKMEKKTSNYMANLRKAELMIYRGTALLEGGIRIAEHLGVKVDQSIKNALNDVQMIVAFLSSATIMATRLRSMLATMGMVGAAAAGGVVGAGVAAGLGAGYLGQSVAAATGSQDLGRIVTATAGPSVGIAGLLMQLFGINPWSRWQR